MDGARERLLAGLPVTERRLELARASTVLLEGGDGPPLVLLHGGIECGGVYWAPVISDLAASHSVVVPDVPGLGESEPLAQLDTDALSDWFAELVRSTCREEPTLIAHSLLGNLAARLAARHGELLRRLVIYGAPGIGPYRMPLRLRVVAIRFAIRPTERNEERFERLAFHDLDTARRRDPEWFEAWSAYSRARAVQPQCKRTMRWLISHCTKEIPDAELRSITVPTGLVWGRHDRFVSLDHAEAGSARLGWTLRVVDDAGHVPHIEQPEAFLRTLRAALSPTSATTQS
jgi:pimeloyl-ACP methyl ester carboxylesterase